MEEIIKKLEEEKKRLEILVDKLNTIIYDLKDYEDLIGEEKEEARDKLLNTEQKIKPIEIDPKLLKKTREGTKWLKEQEKKVSTTQRREIVTTDKKPKRKRRTKAEMQNIQKRRTSQKYPKEVNDFIENNWKKNIDRVLIVLIEEKFDRKYTVDQIKARRRQFGWVSDIVGRKKGERITKSVERDQGPEVKKKIAEDSNKKVHFDSDGKYFCNYKNNKTIEKNLMTKKWEKVTCGRCKRKKTGKPKKYTDEVLEFLKENIDNFSNKEICKELKMRFDIEVKVGNLSNFLSKKGIKREYQSEIDQEIIDFIMESKIEDVYYLRDNIIEKFEKNIPGEKLRELMNQRKNIPGESVKEEVKRIEEKRDALDEDLDEMGLDD